MKRFLDWVLVLGTMASFIYSAFGLWPVWSLIGFVGLGIVYTMFTK